VYGLLCSTNGLVVNEADLNVNTWIKILKISRSEIGLGNSAEAAVPSPKPSVEVPHQPSPSVPDRVVAGPKSDSIFKYNSANGEAQILSLVPGGSGYGLELESGTFHRWKGNLKPGFDKATRFAFNHLNHVLL